MKRILIAALLCASLAACHDGSDSHAVSAGERVVYQPVYKRVREPCPATEPAPPAKLAKPYPADLGALVDVLLAKLGEYTKPGKYVARVHDFAAICTKPVPADGTPAAP